METKSGSHTKTCTNYPSVLRKNCVRTEVIAPTSFACAAVPCSAGDFDEAHLFVEKDELSEDEQQRLRERIMKFSLQTSGLYQISDIHFIEKLPITSVGKVKRFQLKDIALAGHLGGSAQ